jgi:hypothetical protein
VLAALGCATSGAWAGKVGPEFRVNTYTINNQLSSSVAGLSDGGFVVTWTSVEQDGSDYGAYGQRYSSTGNKVGPEFRINTRKRGRQNAPSVAALSAGGFVVTWTSPGDGRGVGVFAQRYSAAGEQLGSEFQVNTYTPRGQGGSSIAALEHGGFVITWTSTSQDDSTSRRYAGVYGQGYDSGGRKVGAEFQINTHTRDNQSNPVVAALRGGFFVVTWTSVDQDSGGDGLRSVHGQRFRGAREKIGSEFQVNSVEPGDQHISSVAGLTDGGFVVTWTGPHGASPGSGVYGLRYNETGARLAPEFKINSSVANAVSNPRSVAALADGGFVATWTSIGPNGGADVFARLFNAAGQAQTSQFRVNNLVSRKSRESLPSVAALRDGGFVVTWTTFDNKGQSDIYGQRYSR